MLSMVASCYQWGVTRYCQWGVARCSQWELNDALNRSFIKIVAGLKHNNGVVYKL